MNYIIAALNNPVFMSAAWGWLSAQILKVIIYTIVNKDFDPSRLLGDGGMPSSHSATVMGLVTASIICYGTDSFEFAVSAILAIIVMHDAMGVRRETGRQAVVLNNMMDLFEQMGSDLPFEKKLKEFVGHTPLQVTMGAILGVIIGLVVCEIMIM